MNYKELKEIIKNGGATLTRDLKRAELKKGFMVSLEGTESKVKKDDLKAILQEIESKQELVKDNNDLYIGLWVDSGFMYIDISINISDKIEALEFAK